MAETKCIIFLDDNGILWINNIFWDSGAFRPDFKLFLKSGVKYNAKIKYARENLQSGNIIVYPKKISLDASRIFINIR